MLNARDIIIRPILTEKSTKIQADNNAVTFEVAKGANKTAVKQAVEEIFKVKVDKVNIVNVRSKKKRIGRHEGTTNAYRKAIVKLTAGQEIDIFAESF
jgi:Ribosomal protein L23